MPRRPRISMLSRYGAAIAAVALALAAKLLLARLGIEATPFLLFFAAVLAAATFGDLGPGLLATGLAGLCSNYFFIHPYHALGVSDPSQRVQLGLFGAEGAVVSGLVAVLHATRRRAEASAAAARGLEQRLLRVSEAEQRRIGHDLHDGLGQHLTGVALLSRSLRQKLEAAQGGDGNGTAADARRVEALVNRAIAWTRDLASHLAPTAVEAGGLCPALQDLAEGASGLFGVECTFRQAGGNGEPILVDDATAVHLYRIAQEAVSNAVKHGGARAVAISIGVEANELVLRIEANGARLPDGWQPAAAAATTKGMGLRTMDYRARAIGGSLDVRNGERRGTVLTCRSPHGGGGGGGGGGGATHGGNGSIPKRIRV